MNSEHRDSGGFNYFWVAVVKIKCYTSCNLHVEILTQDFFKRRYRIQEIYSNIRYVDRKSYDHCCATGLINNLDLKGQKEISGRVIARGKPNRMNRLSETSDHLVFKHVWQISWNVSKISIRCTDNLEKPLKSVVEFIIVYKYPSQQEGILTNKDDDTLMTLKEFFFDFCLDVQIFICIYFGIKQYQTFPVTNL